MPDDDPQADPFASRGWALIRHFLDPSELQQTIADVSNVILLPRQSCMNRQGNDLIPLRWNDTIIARILHSPPRVQRLRDLLRARDLRWLSGYVSSKAPCSPTLWWHQDWWCWNHPISFRRSATQVAVLCYLSDTSEKNGALRVLSGSHLKSVPLHRQLPQPHGEEADQLPLDHPAMADVREQTTLSVKAGDAVVLDYRLLHGTHANDTSRRRDCILLSFLPNWHALPLELKAHLIAHPALPDEAEVSASLASYADVLPHFVGTTADVVINRLPPATFDIA
jgi:hypothetical protein